MKEWEKIFKEEKHTLIYNSSLLGCEECSRGNWFEQQWVTL